jgi:hypothetical protein
MTDTAHKQRARSTTTTMACQSRSRRSSATFPASSRMRVALSPTRWSNRRMRSFAHIAAVIALAGCPRGDRATAATPDTMGASKMTKGQTTVITGITKTFSRDGALEATFASPRVTLDAAGDVVTEERLSATGTLEVRKQFACGKLVTEEHFTADCRRQARRAHRVPLRRERPPRRGGEDLRRRHASRHVGPTTATPAVA